MRVTEVRIKLNPQAQDRLRAFCTITLDGAFVVRDIKVIDGPNGVFVAMPSRKLMDHCPRCRAKNHLRARFCNQCGSPLDEARHTPPTDTRPKLHCDVAHPINAGARAAIQGSIVKAYQDELVRSHQPGYIPPKMDEIDEDFEPNGA